MTLFYMIGVGGAGMSVVAELLMAEGHQVAGSDREESENTRLLRELGATIYIGHKAEQVPEQAVVVVSSAIKDVNPELVVARQREQKIIHRSQALALAAGGRSFVAVAGAHGKTSTSAMLAVALRHLGRDPSHAIGGSLVGGLSGGYLGAGNVLVAEADESDASFLNYSPRVEIVTNVEPDHLDHYGTREAFEQAFVDFAHLLGSDGLLIACADDPGSLVLARQAAADGIRVWTYGRRSAGIDVRCDGRRDKRTAQSDMLAHAQLIDVSPSREGALASADIEFRGERYHLDLAVPGKHMLLNAVGAWLAGVELGESGEDMAQALSSFRGASRRFELVGEKGGVRVIDDYAHHPTEIAAALHTARSIAHGGNIHVVFQPHLYSRTKNFAPEFAQALSVADRVIVTGVYAAREVPSDGCEGDAISELMTSVPFIPDMADAACEVVSYARPGDIIMTVGAGSITQMGSFILQELEKNMSYQGVSAQKTADSSERGSGL